MSFKSIWGDMNIGTPVKPAENPPASTQSQISSQNSDADPEEEEEDDDSSNQNPNASVQTDVTASAAPASTATVEDPVIEFSEEDAEKAFALLDAQGVLNIDDDEEFDATPEGIAGAVAASIRKGVEDSLANAPEAVKKLYLHLTSGNDESTFVFPDPPIKWADVDQEDEDVKKDAVEEFLRMQGLTDDEIEEELEDIISSDKLDKKASLAFKALEKRDEETEAKKAQQKSAAEQARIKAVEEEIKKVKEKISSIDEIAGFKMTDKRRAEFENYLFKVDKKTGLTQLQKNMQDEERKLKIAFLDFVEFNKEDIKTEVNTEVVTDRKRKLSRQTRRGVANTNSSVTVAKDKNTSGKLVIPSIFSAPRTE